MSKGADGDVNEALCLLDADDAAPRLCRADAGSVAVFSRRGPGKQHNEDGALVVPLGERLVVAVADGMGGLPAGELASRLALEALAARLAEPDAGTSTRAAVVEGFERANQRVLAESGGAGTTLIAAILTRSTVRIVHAGDSEALLVGQRGRLKLRTVAHSPTGYALHAGLIGEEDAMVHEDRHILSNAVGMPTMSIEIGPRTTLAPRDTLVLATDGLFDNLTAEEVAEAVRKGPLEGAATRAAEGAWLRMGGAGDDSTEAPGKPDDLTLAVFRPAPASNRVEPGAPGSH